MTDLIKFTALQFGIDEDEMFSTTRVQAVCNARQVCMYFMRVYGYLSFRRVGKYFGKDHATAMHACNTVKRHCEYEKKFKAKVDKITEAYASGLLLIPDTGWEAPEEVTMVEERLIEIQ